MGRLRGILIGIAIGAALVVSPFVLFILGRGHLVSARVDSTDQAPPPWLPAHSTRVDIRGTKASHWFTGGCRRTDLEAWASDKHIPLKKSDQESVRAYDMRRAPMEWKTHKELRAESLEIELDGKNTLIWEKRADDGGGITLIFDTTTDTFYGDRSLW